MSTLNQFLTLSFPIPDFQHALRLAAVSLLGILHYMTFSMEVYCPRILCIINIVPAISFVLGPPVKGHTNLTCRPFSDNQKLQNVTMTLYHTTIGMKIGCGTQ